MPRISKKSAASPSPFGKLPNFKVNRRIIIILGIIILAALAYLNKNFFIAATVNSQPISTLELLQRLNNTYRERTLNQMVNEKILEQEGIKKGVSVTPQEVQAKIAEVEKQYGEGELFDSLLEQQGLTRDEFTRQTRLQLLVQKMYQQQSSPSAEEIEKYIEANKDNPEATEPAQFRQTAIEMLKQQNLSQIFNENFQKLKQDAKITIF